VTAKLGETQSRYAGPPFTRPVSTREPEQWYVLWRKTNGAAGWEGPLTSRAACRGVARQLVGVTRVIFAKGRPG